MPRDSEHRSDALGLGYTLDPGGILFEDGVRYTLPEAMEVSRTASCADDVRAVHLIKKRFDGRIIVPAKPKPRRRVTLRHARVFDGREE